MLSLKSPQNLKIYDENSVDRRGQSGGTSGKRRERSLCKILEEEQLKMPLFCSIDHDYYFCSTLNTTTASDANTEEILAELANNINVDVVSMQRVASTNDSSFVVNTSDMTTTSDSELVARAAVARAARNGMTRTRESPTKDTDALEILLDVAGGDTTMEVEVDVTKCSSQADIIDSDPNLNGGPLVATHGNGLLLDVKVDEDEGDCLDESVTLEDRRRDLREFLGDLYEDSSLSALGRWTKAQPDTKPEGADSRPAEGADTKPAEDANSSTLAEVQMESRSLEVSSSPRNTSDVVAHDCRTHEHKAPPGGAGRKQPEPQQTLEFATSTEESRKSSSEGSVEKVGEGHDVKEAPPGTSSPRGVCSAGSSPVDDWLPDLSPLPEKPQKKRSRGATSSRSTHKKRKSSDNDQQSSAQSEEKGRSKKTRRANQKDKRTESLKPDQQKAVKKEAEEQAAARKDEDGEAEKKEEEKSDANSSGTDSQELIKSDKEEKPGDSTFGGDVPIEIAPNPESPAPEEDTKDGGVEPTTKLKEEEEEKEGSDVAHASAEANQDATERDVVAPAASSGEVTVAEDAEKPEVQHEDDPVYNSSTDVEDEAPSGDRTPPRGQKKESTTSGGEEELNDTVTPGGRAEQSSSATPSGRMERDGRATPCGGDTSESEAILIKDEPVSRARWFRGLVLIGLKRSCNEMA